MCTRQGITVVASISGRVVNYIHIAITTTLNSATAELVLKAHKPMYASCEISSTGQREVVEDGIVLRELLAVPVSGAVHTHGSHTHSGLAAVGSCDCLPWVLPLWTSCNNCLWLVWLVLKDARCAVILVQVTSHHRLYRNFH